MVAAANKSTVSDAQWDDHVERCKSSGMSRSRYAKINQLNYDQLNYRCRKAILAEKHSVKKPTKTRSGNFVEVKAQAVQVETERRFACIRVTTTDGLKLEVEQAWSPQTVVEFLKLWGRYND